MLFVDHLWLQSRFMNQKIQTMILCYVWIGPMMHWFIIKDNYQSYLWTEVKGNYSNSCESRQIEICTLYSIPILFFNSLYDSKNQDQVRMSIRVALVKHISNIYQFLLIPLQLMKLRRWDCGISYRSKKQILDGAAQSSTPPWRTYCWLWDQQTAEHSPMKLL